MAVTKNAPVPRAPIAEPVKNAQGKTELVVTLPFAIYLRDLRTDIDNAPRSATATPISQTTKNASVVTTDILTPTSDGLYSFQFSAAVMTADGVSSSLTTVLGWTQNTVAKTKSFTAMTGNTVTTTASDTYLFFADASAPITYALTYVSNTPGQMVYDFYAVLSTVAGVS